MSNTELPTKKKMESSPEPRQRTRSPAAIFASLIVYLISGMIVMLIMLVIFLYGSFPASLLVCGEWL